MTNEEAIAIIRNEYKCVDRDCDIERSCGKCDLMMPNKEPILEAYKLAIKALEQEPTDTWSIKDVADTFKKHGLIREQEPCDDMVSRDAVIKGIEELKRSPWATANRGHGYEYLITEALDVVEDLCVKRSPSVTQKSAKDYLDMADRKAKKIKDALTVTQKSGKWIRWYEMIESADGKITEHIPHCKCSECGKEYDPHSSQFIKYCSKCGAKMQESECDA